jgi:hypothetical protein
VQYNAVEAYRTQVEAAQRAEKEREAAEVEWLKVGAFTLPRCALPCQGLACPSFPSVLGPAAARLACCCGPWCSHRCCAPRGRRTFIQAGLTLLPLIVPIDRRQNYYLDLGLDAAAAHSAANGDPAAQALAIPLIAAREAAAAAAAAAATAAALAAAPPAAWSGGGRGGRGRGRGRGGRGSGGAAVATWDAGVDADGPASKRQRLLPPRPFQQPWEPLEVGGGCRKTGMP